MTKSLAEIWNAANPPEQRALIEKRTKAVDDDEAFIILWMV